MFSHPALAVEQQEISHLWSGAAAAHCRVSDARDINTSPLRDQLRSHPSVQRALFQ